MDNKRTDIKEAWNTSISNIVDETEYAIDNAVEQIKKSRIDSTNIINNYQDDVYSMAKNIMDRSIEMQRELIINLFRLPFAGNYPIINTFLAIPFEDVIRQIENTADIYAKMLISLLESSNVSASSITNNTKSANRHLMNISLDQLQYNTTQMSGIVKNAMGVVKDLSRIITGENAPREQEDMRKIERYVYIEFPRQIPTGKTAPLTVLVKDKSRGSSLTPSSTMAMGIGQIELKVPPNKQEIQLLACFSQEDSKFDLEDKSYCKEIIVPINDEDSQPVVFDLTAKSEGIAKIAIRFFKAGMGAAHIGEIPLQSVILDATKPMDESVSDYLKQIYVPVAIGKFHSDISLVNPDVTLLIIETRSSADSSNYEVYLISQTIGHHHVGTISLSNAAKSNFRETFKQIERTDIPAGIIDDNLKNIGLELYKEIIPSNLDKLYWELRSNIKSIHILSKEPWIPWEIIKPFRKKEGNDLVDEDDEDDFLCERYAFCRWQINIHPTTKEQIGKIKVIVPSVTTLKGVLEERNWIEKFAESNRLNISFASSYDEVMDTFKNGDYDIIHFSTHGKHNADAPVLSEIDLGNGYYLQPNAINGRATNFGKSHPLVILNACESGKLDFSFTAVQGWATQFLEAGASAFICTLWSVTDQIALKFTKELYSQLFNGVRLGEAVRISRLKCRKSGDPSWLAYQVYGHPNMKVELKYR